MTTSLRSVGDAELEVTDWGSGEPLVFIQTALTADELLPLARDEALAGYRKIVYHRRGYAGSSPAVPPGSIARDAHDCVGLLAALGIERAHVVGFSYSGAVAMPAGGQRAAAYEQPGADRTATGPRGTRGGVPGGQRATDPDASGAWPGRGSRRVPLAPDRPGLARQDRAAGPRLRPPDGTRRGHLLRLRHAGPVGLGVRYPKTRGGSPARSCMSVGATADRGSPRSAS